MFLKSKLSELCNLSLFFSWWITDPTKVGFHINLELNSCKWRQRDTKIFASYYIREKKWNCPWILIHKNLKCVSETILKKVEKKSLLHLMLCTTLNKIYSGNRKAVVGAVAAEVKKASGWMMQVRAYWSPLKSRHWFMGPKTIWIRTEEGEILDF